MSEKPWTVNQLSEFLDRSPGAIRNLVLRRAIPYRKVGGRLMFLESEIQKWIEIAPGLKIEDLIKKNERRAFGHE